MASLLIWLVVGMTGVIVWLGQHEGIGQHNGDLNLNVKALTGMKSVFPFKEGYGKAGYYSKNFTI
jgi:hypothetical protein